MKTNRRIWCPLILLVTSSGITAPATAQTPDEEPPPLENICDLETGAAYGTCNAYCEAMDCELANDDDPLTEPSASPAACAKVASKFEQLTGRELPCEASCPCTSDPLNFPVWNAVLWGDLVPDLCRADAWFCDLWGVPAELCTPPEGDRLQARVPGNPFVISYAIGYDLNPFFPVKRLPACGEIPGPFLTITRSQGAACRSQLQSALDATGLACDGGS